MRLIGCINQNGTFEMIDDDGKPLNTSIVSYDYNNDGDDDLFIGNLSNPNSLVTKPTLTNDKGNFNVGFKVPI
jgi:hypothetical protein